MSQKQGGSPKIGRANRPGPKARRARYRGSVWPYHKLRRVLRGNGYEAALAYARAPERLWIGALDRIIASRPRWARYCLPPALRGTARQRD